MALDLKFVHSQFPTLDQNNFVYLDNAGGSLVLKRVVDRVSNHLLKTPVQHGASYSTSIEASNRLSKSAKTIANLIGAVKAEEIIFGPSATILIKLLAESYGKFLTEGDEIIVSEVEHEANRGAWENLSYKGVKIIPWALEDEKYTLSPESLKPLLSEKTKLVVVSHVSNILGAINPIKKITNLVHNHGAKVMVDGVAFSPHRRVDVKALGVDYYVFSFYKLFGPHLACLYGQHETLLKLPGINHKSIDENRVPYKFQPGNPNYELAWGTGGIVEYLKKLGQRTLGNGSGIKASLDEAFEQISNHEQKLTKQLLDFLKTIEDIEIIGPKGSAKKERISIISFIKKGKSSLDIVSELDGKDIGIRYGDFYSINLVKNLNLEKYNGVVRVSIAHYNTTRDIEKLIKVLKPIIK
ncbi:MAG: aminotransferase class V-fold PLP-dependent enzyme [Sphingomonadales bacterium]